jgi:hypothetical protein
MTLNAIKGSNVPDIFAPSPCKKGPLPSFLLFLTHTHTLRKKPLSKETPHPATPLLHFCTSQLRKLSQLLNTTSHYVFPYHLFSVPKHFVHHHCPNSQPLSTDRIKPPRRQWLRKRRRRQNPRRRPGPPHARQRGCATRADEPSAAQGKEGKEICKGLVFGRLFVSSLKVWWGEWIGFGGWGMGDDQE